MPDFIIPQPPGISPPTIDVGKLIPKPPQMQIPQIPQFQPIPYGQDVILTPIDSFIPKDQAPTPPDISTHIPPTYVPYGVPYAIPTPTPTAPTPTPTPVIIPTVAIPDWLLPLGILVGGAVVLYAVTRK